MTAHRAALEVLRRRLGTHLATYRQAAGLSQPELAQKLGKTRSLVSKIEHGQRGISAELWQIADDACGAHGALAAEHRKLVQAEQDYRDWCRAQRRQARQAAAQDRIPELAASPAPVLPRLSAAQGKVATDYGYETWPDSALVGGPLAAELMHVITQLVRSMSRRDAVRVISSTLAAVGLAGLDPDEYTRLAQAVASPHRTDARVVENLAVTLAHSKRLEDQLGPCQVIDTVVAQHELVRRLLTNDCPPQLHKPLNLVDSNMASTIGGYLIDMGHPEQARRYFVRARRAAHDATNPAYAAYAAIKLCHAAFLCRDTPAALDNAAAARSLAARTGDTQLKALAELRAAGAYALDGQHSPCVAAIARAHDLLTGTNGVGPDSPAYWMDHGTINSGRSAFLALLGRPEDAVEAAVNNTRTGFVRVCAYALSELRLATALILTKEIAEATRILGDVAGLAHLSPRLTADLRTARSMLQPWATTRAVTTLDTQLRAYGLHSTPTQQ